jgi:hypothetical protein
MIDGNVGETITGMNEWQEKQKSSEETFPSAALSTTEPT